MMYRKISLSILCLFVTHLVFAIQGELPGVFSVSSTKKVRFAQGNLQFNANLGTHLCADGTTQVGIWRFAPEQYELVGYKDGGPRPVISSDGWQDAFCYGTSGWNSGSERYYPWAEAALYEQEKYYPASAKYEYYNLEGKYAYADWGWYNSISNGGEKPCIWRVLSKTEWDYLLYSRENVQTKYFFANVNGHTGMVLLPDNWYADNLTISSTPNVPSTNKIDAEEWTLWEQSGAVFLPQRCINCGEISSSVGLYWSSSSNGNGNYGYAYVVRYRESMNGSQYWTDITNAQYGTANYVRVVRDVIDETYTISVEPNNADFGTTTGGTTDGSLGEQLTISATPKECYLFYNWSDGSTDNPHSITIEGDASYVAVFVKQQYNVVAQSDNDAEGTAHATKE